MKALFNIEKPSNVSTKFQLINTSEVVEHLKQDGWQVTQYSETKSRKHDAKYGKHLIRLNNPKFRIDSENELNLLLTNAHNGKSSFRIDIGIYRFVCANGLVVGNTYDSQRIHHVGNTIDRVRESIDNIDEVFERVAQNIQYLQGKSLSRIELDKLIRSEVDLRINKERYLLVDSMIENNMRPIRQEDDKNDAYTQLNVLQERFVRGGIQYAVMDKETEGFQFRRLRKLKGIDSIVGVNKRLWDNVFKLVG